MRFEITRESPIENNFNEFCDFLAEYSDSFSLTGCVKDIAESKRKKKFDAIYHPIFEHLIREERSRHFIEYYFEIVPETIAWLKKLSHILRIPWPLNRISFQKDKKVCCFIETYHIIFIMKIENEVAVKKLQAILDKPFKVVHEFIDKYNHLKNSLTEADFIQEMSRSSFENKYFLQQFDRDFFKLRWDDKIINFYTDNENLKLFARILICRGAENLTDTDLFFMSFWLMGFEQWFRINSMKFNEVFSGSGYIYDFLGTIDAERFVKNYLKIIMQIDIYISNRLKLLIEIFEKLGCKIDDPKLSQANAELINAYKEWSGNDIHKVRTMRKRFEYIMQIQKINIYLKRQSRRKHVLIGADDTYEFSIKGPIYAREDNFFSQKFIAYEYLNIGTLFYKKAAAKSIFWLDRVAKHGDLDCQIDLGKCYLNGIGVKKDLEKSKYWLEKASQQGSIAAKELLSKIQK